MENKESYSRKKMLLFPLSFLFSLLSLLVYRHLPASNFANSLDHSGMYAVYVFIFSPVLALIAAAVFHFAMIKNREVFVPLLGKKVYKALDILFTALFAFGFVISVSYLIFQWKLGFLSPFDGTVYQTLCNIMLIGLMITVSFFLVVTIIIKNKK